MANEPVATHQDAPLPFTPEQWLFFDAGIDMLKRIREAAGADRLPVADIARFAKIRGDPRVQEQLISLGNQLSYALKQAKERGLL